MLNVEPSIRLSNAAIRQGDRHDRLTARGVSPILGFMSITSCRALEGFEPVVEAFERNFQDELELGAGFSAWLGDELVVDIQGGWSDRQQSRPWNELTLCPVYSTTKPIAALVVALMVERGRLRYDAPVAEFWPEFGAAGKSRMTVADVLSHQGGLPGFVDPIDPALWLDPVGLSELLARQTPMSIGPGGSAYHPLTWGYLAGELVRRVDGRSLGRVLRDDICAPLGLDFWIGTPKSEHHRCCDMIKPRSPAQFAGMNDAVRAAFLQPWSAPNRGAAEWREAEIPSANGHGTSASTARLYSAFANRGRIGPHQILSEAVWDQLTRERVHGPDLILPGDISFAAGVMRNSLGLYGPNAETLCHSGWGGSGAFGDPVVGLSGAYVMNRQGSHLLQDQRRQRLIDALYRCV